MPIYQNDLKVIMNIDGKHLLPGQAVSTLKWYHEPGLVLLEPIPTINPIIYSKAITENAMIPIPIRDANGEIRRFLIHFYLVKGEALVKFNSLDNDPPLMLYEDAKWNLRCYDRELNSIFIQFVDGISSKLYVTIERI